jgi:hypothetical protein
MKPVRATHASQYDWSTCCLSHYVHYAYEASTCNWASQYDCSTNQSHDVHYAYEASTCNWRIPIWLQHVSVIWRSLPVWSQYVQLMHLDMIKTRISHITFSAPMKPISYILFATENWFHKPWFMRYLCSSERSGNQTSSKIAQNDAVEVFWGH